MLNLASASERTQAQEQLRLIAEKERQVLLDVISFCSCAHLLQSLQLAQERLLIARERKELLEDRTSKRDCGYVFVSVVSRVRHTSNLDSHSECQKNRELAETLKQCLMQSVAEPDVRFLRLLFLEMSICLHSCYNTGLFRGAFRAQRTPRRASGDICLEDLGTGPTYQNHVRSCSETEAQAGHVVRGVADNAVISSKRVR
jgi:hypothetical protein